MPVLGIGPRDGLYYEHRPPTAAGRTFVFFNALTADTAMWEPVVAPLRDAGHGTGRRPRQSVVRLSWPGA
jgi:hypothetical protein